MRGEAIGVVHVGSLAVCAFHGVSTRINVNGYVGVFAAATLAAAWSWYRRRVRGPLLSAEDIKAGLKLMHPVNGYCHLVEDDTGLIQPFDFDLAAVRDLRSRFALRAHDIVIATYPKCGTTWMQQVVLLLLRGAEAECAPMRDAPWLEMSVSSAANGCKSSSPPLSVDKLCRLPPADPCVNSGRRVWKTHAPEPHAPWRGAGAHAAAAAGAKVIVVARNAKDAAVSMLYHTANIAPFQWHGGWAEFAPLFFAGQLESNSFWDWYEGWWRASRAYPPTVLWITYEEMSADLPAAVAKVARHLGLQTSSAEIRRVAERSGFVSMREEQARRDALATARGDHVKQGHLRQGQVGGWRAVLRACDTAAFDAKNLELAAACEGLLLYEGEAV